MKRLATTLLLPGMLALQAACSSVPTSASIPDIPAGTEVQLAVVIPEWQSPNTLTDAEGIILLGTGGAAAGALSGAAIGVGASFACGPAALFCAALAVPAGVITGGIVGLSAGASHGASVGISAEEARELEALAQSAQLKHTHPESLASTFRQHAGDLWETTASDSAVRITLGVAPLRIEQDKYSLVRFHTKVSALVDYGDGTKPRTYTFPRMMSLQSVDKLTANDGEMADRLIGLLYEHGLRQVVVALSDSITGYAPPGSSTRE